jgi:hypothetical protein
MTPHVRLHIQLEPQLGADLQRAAHAQGVSTSELIRRGVRKVLEDLGTAADSDPAAVAGGAEAVGVLPLQPFREAHDVRSRARVCSVLRSARGGARRMGRVAGGVMKLIRATVTSSTLAIQVRVLRLSGVLASPALARRVLVMCRWNSSAWALIAVRALHLRAHRGRLLCPYLLLLFCGHRCEE